MWEGGGAQAQTITAGECSCHLLIHALSSGGADSALTRAAAVPGSGWSCGAGGHLSAFPHLSCSPPPPAQPGCTPLLPLTGCCRAGFSLCSNTLTLSLSDLLAFGGSGSPGFLCAFLAALGSLGSGLCSSRHRLNSLGGQPGGFFSCFSELSSTS